MRYQAITLAIFALVTSLSEDLKAQSQVQPASSIDAYAVKSENLERVLNAKLIEQFSPGLALAVVSKWQSDFF